MLNCEVCSTIHMSVQLYYSVEDYDEFIDTNKFILPKEMFTSLLKSCLHAESKVSNNRWMFLRNWLQVIYGTKTCVEEDLEIVVVNVHHVFPQENFEKWKFDHHVRH